MISPRLFINLLDDYGYKSYSGVPCSFLSGLIVEVQKDHNKYIAAPNEGSALGICSGMYLGNCKSVLLMQNSGLGNIINPLTSLNLIYKIPALLIIGGRGYEIDDEPQHDIMGTKTHELLSVFGIPAYNIDKGHSFEEIINKADSYIKEQKLPAAIIVKKGTFNEPEKSLEIVDKVDQKTGEVYGFLPFKHSLERSDTIELITSSISSDTFIISTTGKISRELFMIADRKKNFYMQGSMGHASAIGLGLAVACPEKKIMILDGDGAILMHMGIAATIGMTQPENLIHVVLDNGYYESTGSQPTPSSHINLPLIGRACNYRESLTPSKPSEIKDAITHATSNRGPYFIYIRVKNKKAQRVPRITSKYTAPQITENFTRSIISKL